MKTFRIWNKQDEINGVDAGVVINSQKIKPQDEIFLVVDEYGKVTQIEEVTNIKSIYKLDAGLSAVQTAQTYLDLMAQQEEQVKQDVLTLEQQADKISTLETQQASTEYILMMGGLI